ncbi:MAG: HK97 family phage prohead protease [Acetivibrio ethanolgignens]
MRIELRSDSVLIDGYVNAVGRDSRPIRGENGERFIEQIVPGAFKRALERAREVKLMLNHDRVIGSTETNLKLIEDSIGLRAICEVTDPETVQKAREKKLRGWSFGFLDLKASEEDTASGMKRRFVEEMELKEVTIVDDRKTPCYAGTSINTRADGEEERLETRSQEFEAIYEEQKAPLNYETYKQRIRALEGQKEGKNE